MVIQIKSLFVLTLALLPVLSNAGQITMVNPQEEQTENGKTLCIIRGGHNAPFTAIHLTYLFSFLSFCIHCHRR